MAIAMVRALRPALPAVIGAAALTFLFAAVMPLAWIAGISWNLYLDRLSALFEPPIGNGARLALALGMAVFAALIAGLVALALARPDAVLPRLRRRASTDDDGAAEDPLPRRRADFHPDDPPRPPIRAGRDLPAEGLGPLGAPATVDDSFDNAEAEDDDTLVLADLAPADPAEGEEPWLQPAELTSPPPLDPVDRSLGAMVARLEAGLARRRQGSDMPESSDRESDPDAAVGPVDFALEAALGTLQRMNRQAAR